MTDPRDFLPPPPWEGPPLPKILKGKQKTMKIGLTMDEIIYLENTLRMIQGTGQPIGLKEGEDLAGSILGKLEEI